MVALSATDFGNFITHPLIKPPSPPMSSTKNNAAVLSESGITFEKENVTVNPLTGSVEFYGNYGGSKWKFTLKRDPESTQKAKICATLAENCDTSDSSNDKKSYDGEEERLAITTSEFFNEMVFDLDGTFLSFEDMMLTDKGEEASVMLSLRITVKKFPSPGIEF